MTARPAKRARRRRSEDALHIAVAQYLDVALPSNALWWHTPNGGKRSKAEAGRFKAMGVKAGVADCIIVWLGRAYAIELKSDDGDMSAAQHSWADAFEAAQGLYAVCRSTDEVEGWLRGWGIPLRATLNPGGGWRRAA